MMKRWLISVALVLTLVMAFLVTPVSAGLTITEGDKVTSSVGVTSPVITFSGSDFPDGGTITINVSSLHTYVASPPFTDANVQISSDALAAYWWGVMDGDGINLTLTSAGGNTTSGENVTVAFTGATGYPWVDNSGGNQTLPLTVTRTDTGETATINFMIETVSGLKVTDGETIISPYGATSPVITVTGSDIPDGGTITIDLYYALGLLASWTYTDENIAISSNATAATWTPAVTGNSLTLTSVGGNTSVGETITVNFTGTAGNPWTAAYTGGPVTYPLTATRSDGYDPKSFSISMDMVPPVSTGLSIENGDPITTTLGATTPVITITEPIEEGGNITIFVPFLSSIIASGSLNDANVVVNDTAVNANWTPTVTADRVILTSTGGPTAIGETVNVTFTGAANPWIVSLPVGVEYPFTTAVRGDERGAGYFTFAISTQDPTDLIIEEGAKINTTYGATSPVITITGPKIVPEGTIFIDLSGLNLHVANRQLTNANVIVNDTAANATWTRNVTGGFGNTFLTLTSTGGPTVAGENITVTFTGAVNPWSANTNGEKTESLFVTRTDGAGWGNFNFVIETTPPPESLVSANFSASPTSDLAPLTVTFTDSSLRSPTSWSWDFGDGATSIKQNPIHEYILPGYYKVSLTVTNAYGSDTKTRWDYIKVLKGEVREANTTLAGLAVTNCGSPQTITVDSSVLPAALIPNNSVLEIQPPADRGLKNITLYALDGVGFSQNGNLISGDPTGVHLVTEDLALSSGFSSDVGTNASFNLSMDLPVYPCNAILSTKIMDGIITEYDTKLWQVASNNSAVPIGTAYTATITRINFPNATNVRVHMSVNSSWNPSLLAGPGNMYIWRIADDGNSGQILPTTYLYNNTADNLDYFEADSPLGMSTFGISSFTGSNNPFQVIAFVAAAVISPPGNPGPAAVGGTGGGGGTSSAVYTTDAPGATSLDSGKTTKIYTNAEGTITQATLLPSTDGLANVFLGLGIVARNSNGMPLPSISIMRIPVEELTTAPLRDGLSFTGMAYELKPDGATFSPSIPLSFTIPQDLGGKEYIIQELDDATGTWQALPGSFNPDTGIITVQVSHLCRFALFAQATETNAPETNTATNAKAKIAPLTKPAMSTNIGMVGWGLSTIRENPLVLIIIIAIIGAVAYFGWWKKRL